jgi:DNA-binding MarR family transcriptional regulator
MAYKKLFFLADNEIPAKINAETGEIQEFRDYKNNLPLGKEIFESKALFKKTYEITEEFLDNVLTPLEFAIVMRMARMAKMNTNSLEPLSDESTLLEIAQELKVNRRDVKNILKKLFELGVYGRFEVCDYDKTYKKYWVLNPYIRFQGKVIDSSIKNLFTNTKICKIYREYVDKNKIY